MHLIGWSAVAMVAAAVAISSLATAQGNSQHKLRMGSKATTIAVR